MDFYEELQKLTVDEYQSFQEKDLSSSGSENLDKEIVKALRDAADGYENGEILETSDVLWEINEAISAYTNYVDQF